jgi:diadenosine tetraphosphate (Ap4A) HIT family hydrolase
MKNEIIKHCIDDDCLFCDIVQDKNNERKKHVNTVVWENENFVVKTDLGSLTAGYLLVIPKRHVLSSAQLSKSELLEFLKLHDTLKNVLHDTYRTIPIMYEHGSDANGQGKFSNSIVHAHPHIVPINFSNERNNKILVEREMESINIERDLRKYSEQSYLLYVDERDNAFISTKPDMPRQYPRKMVAEQLGIDNRWNWRENTYDDLIEQTIKDLDRPLRKLTTLNFSTTNKAVEYGY